MSALFKSKLELDSGPFLGPEVKTRHLSQSCPQNSPMQLPLGVGGWSLTKPICSNCFNLCEHGLLMNIERCRDQKVQVRNHSFHGRSMTDLSELSDLLWQIPIRFTSRGCTMLYLYASYISDLAAKLLAGWRPGVEGFQDSSATSTNWLVCCWPCWTVLSVDSHARNGLDTSPKMWTSTVWDFLHKRCQGDRNRGRPWGASSHHLRILCTGLGNSRGVSAPSCRRVANATIATFISQSTKMCFACESFRIWGWFCSFSGYPMASGNADFPGATWHGQRTGVLRDGPRGRCAALLRCAKFIKIGDDCHSHLGFER